jgi:phage terminase large subunit
VFTNVEYADEMPPIEACKFHCFGLDFGYSNDPTAIVEVALCHGKIYYQEHCYRRGLVNTHNPIVPGQPSIQKELERIDVRKFPIVCDSAEPKSIQELRNAGFNVIGAKKGKGSVNQGLDKMQQYPFVIVGGSPNLRKEVRSYVWDKDKDGESLNKPIDAWNHLIDAARYAVSHYLLTGTIGSGKVTFG